MTDLRGTDLMSLLIVDVAVIVGCSL